MPRLKRLKRRDLLSLLGGFGFQVVSTRGSHAKLARTRPSGEKEILIVPVHRQLTTGTIHAIYRQASRFIPEETLRRAFFTE